MELYPDIYFEPKYGQLCEPIEKSKMKVFQYKDENGIVSNQFSYREIPLKIDNRYWYDIVTPYGYGGPVILSCVDKDKRKILTKNYMKSFTEYCNDNYIVSEFIRFHPIVDNAPDFVDAYNCEKIRNTVATDLKNDPDPFNNVFSKSSRKNVRKAIKEGVKCEVIVSPDNLDDFNKIYEETMKRNNATDYYYFGKEYFDDCIKLFKDNLLLINAYDDGILISSRLQFIYNKVIHSHLSGTLNEYMSLSPEYLLQYEMIKWGIENGYELIHQGGGRSNSSDDNLFVFKKQFGNILLDFWIGKKIYNKTIYDKLVDIRKTHDDFDAGSGFFPLYRA